MKAHYDNDGNYVSFCDRPLLDTVPTPYIELTDAQYAEALTGRFCVINGIHALMHLTVGQRLDELNREYFGKSFEIKRLYASAGLGIHTEGKTEAEIDAEVDAVRDNLKNIYDILYSEVLAKQEVILNG
jgi:hypothetical protein